MRHRGLPKEDRRGLLALIPELALIVADEIVRAGDQLPVIAAQ
jgi:hypothetical protein